MPRHSVPDAPVRVRARRCGVVVLDARAAPSFALAAILIAASAIAVQAGSFSVSPFRIHLDRDHPSSVLRIQNQGDGRTVVQIGGVEWTQDPAGTDRYEPSADLVLFPKIVEIEGREEKFVRIGLPNPERSERERAMRVFVEELPVPRPGATGLQVGLRFGVPVFFTPAGALPEPRIEALELGHDTLLVRLRNQGNASFIAGKLTALAVDSTGATTFSGEEAGWYVLAGAARTFRLHIGPEASANSRTIRVSITIVDTRSPDRTSSLEAHLEVPGRVAAPGRPAAAGAIPGLQQSPVSRTR